MVAVFCVKTLASALDINAILALQERWAYTAMVCVIVIVFVSLIGEEIQNIKT